jgi:hypothetical protein
MNINTPFFVLGCIPLRLKRLLMRDAFIFCGIPAYGSYLVALCYKEAFLFCGNR